MSSFAQSHKSSELASGSDDVTVNSAGEGDAEQVIRDMRAAFPEENIFTIRRFCTARRFKFDDAKKMLEDHIKWREEYLPTVTKENTLNELQKGKCYVRGKDNQGHPIIIYRTARGDPWCRDIEEQMKMVIYRIEEALQDVYKYESNPESENDQSSSHLTEYGYNKDGKIMVLVDRVMSARKNVDIEGLRPISAAFDANYPERLHIAIMHPVNLLLISIFSIVQWFFDARTRRKISLVRSEEGLQRWIDPEHLPTRLGGTDTYEFDLGSL